MMESSDGGAVQVCGASRSGRRVVREALAALGVAATDERAEPVAGRPFVLVDGGESRALRSAAMYSGPPLPPHWTEAARCAGAEMAGRERAAFERGENLVARVTLEELDRFPEAALLRILEGLERREPVPGAMAAALEALQLRTGEETRHARARSRILFVHVPKTGGTTASAVLFGTRAANHARLEVLLPERRGRLVAAFVREPLDRARSIWRYRRAGGNGSSLDRWIADHFPPTFAEFLERWEEMRAIDPIMVRHQWELLGGPPAPGAAGVDFLGRFERLEADLRTLCRLAGVAPPAVIPRLRAAPPVPAGDGAAEALTSAQRASAEALFAGDRRFCGYGGA